MDNILFLTFGILIGGFLIWLFRKYIAEKKLIAKDEHQKLQEEFTQLETTKNTLENSLTQASNELKEIKKEKEQSQAKIVELSSELSSAKTTININAEKVTSLEDERKELKEEISGKTDEVNSLNKEVSELTSSNKSQNESLTELKDKNKELDANLNSKIDDLIKTKERVTELDEKNKNLNEKLETQKGEIEKIQESFVDKFNKLANEIFENKSKKFTDLNKEQLKNILEPLGKNIEEFKNKVDETHKKDIEDRASMQERIKSMVESSNKISTEANNLAKALKGSSKKQGDWGEMILENILEASGLTKGREYFAQEFLKDESGQIIKDESGRKMQPDVILKYPDNRKVIIDSKVSLVAYDKFNATEDIDKQDKALDEHLISIRAHIDNLSNKNYQDFAHALDFVMLFVPIEPAYLLAMQKDPNLWNYAYKKRILLISPTNLIAALKLVSDLWQREDQNQNAKEIADRGGKLYDKFVNFVNSLSNVGTHIERTQKSYDDAMKQLKTGSGNLIGQAQKLKKLKVDAKKEIPQTIIEDTDLSE